MINKQPTTTTKKVTYTVRFDPKSRELIIHFDRKSIVFPVDNILIALAKYEQEKAASNDKEDK